MKNISHHRLPLVLIFAMVLVLTGCSGDINITDVKDNFCGIHMDYRYCKCAFHNQHCNDIKMSKNEAKDYVFSAYEDWKYPTEEEDLEEEN